ncbi:hypothetical protein [Spirosoma litoris]
MARLANELSATQLDPVAFENRKAKIRRFTAPYLATLGNISQTTIYQYLAGKAINPKKEEELERVIDLAIAAKEAKDTKAVDKARNLAVA